MKTVLLLLVLAATQDAQRADCTALAATQGAVVTLEKAPAPAPKPAPDGAQAGGPIDTYRDAKALIDKGNALADRGKALLDQAQRDGKITVDVHLPAAMATTPLAASLPGGTCHSGRCPQQSVETTPPAGNPPTPAKPGEACAGGVCPSCPSAAQAPAAAEPAAQHGSETYRLRRAWRWRR